MKTRIRSQVLREAAPVVKGSCIPVPDDTTSELWVRKCLTGFAR